MSNLTDEDLKEESEWIFENSFFENVENEQKIFDFLNSFKKEQCLVVITQILNHYDIPFISKYRREYFEFLLENDRDLWKILDCDEQWIEFKKKEMNNLLNHECLSSFQPSPYLH